MSTAVTKFELHMPLGTTQTIVDASATFKTGMTTLGVIYYELNAAVFPLDGSETERDLIYGLITNAQLAGALSLLNALNTALGTPVVCWTIPAMTQP